VRSTEEKEDRKPFIETALKKKKKEKRREKERAIINCQKMHGGKVNAFTKKYWKRLHCRCKK
jgi:hypothetical protein